jgi:hypothetical protein
VAAQRQTVRARHSSVNSRSHLIPQIPVRRHPYSTICHCPSNHVTTHSLPDRGPSRRPRDAVPMMSWPGQLHVIRSTLVRWARRNCIQPASCWRPTRRPRTEASTRGDLGRRHACEKRKTNDWLSPAALPRARSYGRKSRTRAAPPLTSVGWDTSRTCPSKASRFCAPSTVLALPLTPAGQGAIQRWL